ASATTPADGLRLRLGIVAARAAADGFRKDRWAAIGRMDQRVVEGGDLGAVLRDVMEDQRTTEQVRRAVRQRTVDDAAVEEQHIAGLHLRLHPGQPVRYRDLDAGERLGQVGRLGTDELGLM